MSPLQKILNLGTSSEENPLDKEYIRITNSINLLLIFVVGMSLFLSVVLLSNDGVKSYSRTFLVIAFSTLGLILTSVNQTKLAKILTAIYPSFVLIVYPIFITNFIHAGMFLWIPYALMTIGIIPFFIFSFEKEKPLMYTIIILYLIAIWKFDVVLISHFNKLDDLEFIKKYHLYYVLSKSIISFFLYSSLLFFKYTYHVNRKKLFLLTEELNNKNQALNILNASLENKVTERTAKLSIQNERIKSLAYTNAHEIRAYIARIIGLLNLSNQNISKEEKEYCASKISENILDLDKITQKLSKELIEEN